MRIIYMGTPEFAVPPLAALAGKYDVAAVVTQPDKPRGRGNKVSFSEVKEEALKLNIPVLQPERARGKAFAEQLRGYGADIFVVAAYGQILTESILNIPKYGAVNIHGSLLPKYRGAAPIQQAVIDGEQVTGITIIQMDKGIDTGDMFYKAEIPVLPEDTAGTLHDKLSVLGAKVIIEVLSQIEKGIAVRVKQDDDASSYAPMLTKETGNIDWSMDSENIVNLIRGLNPWPSAYTFIDGNMLKIWKAAAALGDGKPGKVLSVNEKSGILVAAGKNAVLITELQKNGGKKLNAPDFIRGSNITAGMVFQTSK